MADSSAAAGTAQNAPATDSMDVVIERLGDLVQQDFVLSLVIAAVIVVITAVVAKGVGRFLNRLLQREDSPIPSSSIFANIAKVSIWLFGLSFMLSFCFDHDVSGLFTALGIGGLAVSLGAQDTVSNLVGGLNVSLSGLVKPGEKVTVGTTVGEVQDVTWRHTTIVNEVGHVIVVPNSVINTASLVKMPSVTTIVIPIVVTTSADRLTVVAHKIEKAAHAAVSRVCKVKRAPSILFTEITDYGYRGTMSFVISDSTRVRAAKDAAIRAAALYAHGDITEVAKAHIEQQEALEAAAASAAPEAASAPAALEHAAAAPAAVPAAPAKDQAPARK